MAAGDEFRRPVVDYSDWPKHPEDYVLIRADIPGLRKKFAAEVAKNATISLDLEERSFTLTVVLTDAQSKKFRYHVNKLPDAILTDPMKSFCKVKRKEEVAVYLHKATPRTWDVQLKATGLEQEPSD